MNIPARPWTNQQLPRRILAIRLQAMGDTVVTLPYLKGLRESLPPSVEIDFLTREETQGIPKNIHLFHRVFSLGGGRHHKMILLHTIGMLPRLLLRRYDVIIDLQHNIYSKIVLQTLRPKAWALYDKYSPISGAERYRLTISAVGLGENQPSFNIPPKDNAAAKGLQILKEHGWNGEDELVALNPAGAFTTRNWEIPNYATFARLLLRRRPHTKFLVLGTNFIAAKATALKQHLGPHLIDLTGKTTTEEAYSILQRLRLMLSEDSGLMHMSWISGVPTLAIFGSTRADWARPIGGHTTLLGSSDLVCGDCMLASCKYGDVHCLTRYTPEIMLEHALKLFEKTEART